MTQVGVYSVIQKKIGQTKSTVRIHILKCFLPGNRQEVQSEDFFGSEAVFAAMVLASVISIPTLIQSSDVEKNFADVCRAVVSMPQHGAALFGALNYSH